MTQCVATTVPSLSTVSLARGCGQADRGFTTMDPDPVAPSFIELGTAVDLGGDFEIETTVAAPSVAQQTILGDSLSTNNTLSMTSLTITVVDSSGTALAAPAGLLVAQALNLVRLIKQALTLTIFINGTPVASGPFGNFKFDRIGVTQGNLLPFSGIIANVKVKEPNRRVLDMPIDGDYSPANATVKDRARGNNGNFVNVTAGDTTNYKKANGRWVDAQGGILEIAI